MKVTCVRKLPGLAGFSPKYPRRGKRLHGGWTVLFRWADPIRWLLPRNSCLMFGSPAAATGVGKKSKSHAGWDMARPAHDHPHPRAAYVVHATLQAPRKYLDTRDQEIRDSPMQFRRADPGRRGRHTTVMTATRGSCYSRRSQSRTICPSGY